MNIMDKKTIFNIQDAAVKSGEDILFKNISIKINSGELWSVIGENASGKSLLGQLIAGRIKEVEGDIICSPINVGYVSFNRD